MLYRPLAQSGLDFTRKEKTFAVTLNFKYFIFWLSGTNIDAHNLKDGELKFWTPKPEVDQLRSSQITANMYGPLPYARGWGVNSNISVH